MWIIFWITLVFIALPFLAAAFIRAGSEDKDFDEYPWWDNEDWGDKP